MIWRNTSEAGNFTWELPERIANRLEQLPQKQQESIQLILMEQVRILLTTATLMVALGGEKSQKILSVTEAHVKRISDDTQLIATT